MRLARSAQRHAANDWSNEGPDPEKVGPGGVRNRFFTERAGLAGPGAWEDRNEQPMVDWRTAF